MSIFGLNDDRSGCQFTDESCNGCGLTWMVADYHDIVNEAIENICLEEYERQNCVNSMIKKIIHLEKRIIMSARVD